MFYAHFVLAKKGPLARIWLAAHWDKKLTKAHVFETNIEKSVDGILQPKVKMALRTSGHLLLGVVRIYSRKAKYLLADCNEAFVKIKMAFRPGMVDLPEEHREAAVNAITLPEVFHDFDTTMPELNDVDIEAQFSLNQSRAEEITMREDYGSISMVTADEGFGDMGFDSDAPEMMRQAPGVTPSIEEGRDLLFSEPPLDSTGLDKDQEPIPSTSGLQRHETPMEIDSSAREEQFGTGLEPTMICGLFDDTPMGEVPPVDTTIPNPPSVDVPPPPDSDDDMDNFGGPPSAGPPSDDSRPPSSMLQRVPTPTPSVASQPPEIPAEPQPEDAAPPSVDQTTLLQNDEESFALAPVDATALKDDFRLGVTKAKRKRKLIVDEVKNISGEEMKNQLSDTSDIVTTLDLAPPTKRLMHWKETGGVEKLFALPARLIPARQLFKNYQRHLTLRAIGTEDFAMLGDADSLALDQMRDHEEQPQPPPPEPAPTPSRRGRKRKQVEEPPFLEPETPQPTLPPEEMPSLVPPSPMAPPTPFTPQLLQPPTPLMTSPEEMHILPPTPAGIIQTPGYPAPSTPMPHIEEMPHLPPDQVRSILQEQEAIGEGEELMEAPTPHHPGIDASLPLEPLDEHFQQDLPHMEMENMGYEEHLRSHTPIGGISERVPSPWTGDYDFPPSVGPLEEQQVDETDEQFEERVLNKRAYQMFTAVKQKLLVAEQMTLTDMCHRNNKKQVAQKFYSLLVLKKFHVLELEQEGAYEEIYVSKGPKFDNPML